MATVTFVLNKLSRAIVTSPTLAIGRASSPPALQARAAITPLQPAGAVRLQCNGVTELPASNQTTTRSLTTSAGDRLNYDNFETILVTRPREYVASLELNRPKRRNAFALETGAEMVRVLEQFDADKSVRCVVLSGSGPDFTSGVDIKSFMDAYGRLQELDDVAHRARLLRQIVRRFQAPFQAMHEFGKPIVCVQHGLSLGLGMELAACSDVRYCSEDTQMAIREVLIGIAADVGSLQLMPRLSANQSLLMELIYSGRFITCREALEELKFVSRICATKELAIEAALDLASLIASRSPVAVQGSKRNLRFSQGKPLEVGLDYNAVWNAAMMQGGDVVKAIGAIMSKDEEVEYEDC